LYNLATPDELELYRDREQSLIKHQFLTQYLQLAAFKTLQGRSKIFNYVDAFAGPWSVADESEYSDSSFAKAIGMLEGVRVALARGGVTGLKIRFCLCEKRQDAVERLRTYAEKNRKFEIHVFSGPFEENLDAISLKINDGFTFSFIDPTGWNVRNKDIFKFLKDRNGEFLLNYMSDHINRHANFQGVKDSFGRFLNDPNWADELPSLSHLPSDEERVLHILKKRMKAAGVARYTPDFPILVPRSDRIKMRLVLGTHSAKGVEVFRDVEAKVQQQQIEVRDRVRNPEDSQGKLFTSEDHAESVRRLQGVGNKEELKFAEQRVGDLLAELDSISFENLVPGVLEEAHIRPTQFKDLLVELKLKGMVHFDLPPMKKKPQDGTLISKTRRLP
jgi:three-Cys-motif partner protein